MSDEEDISLDSVFTEPPRPPTPNPTVALYHRELSGSTVGEDWTEIEIRLVGTHPLWGNYLWNAARAFASYLDEHRELYRGKCVLELGAGGGLPSIVAAKNGARKVVMTDYPDDELVQNMAYNAEKNVNPPNRERISIQGYIWGRSVNPLLDALPNIGTLPGFDLIILSDLIFNHSQHDALLTTCEQALSRPAPESPVSLPPSVLVFYSHHRPHLAHRDMEFFEKARQRGWHCEEIVTRKFTPMFLNDSGDESVRSTVHGWSLTRSTPGANNRGEA
ncbi:putative S-adenosyl-L-methionine-dependent protein methyltransferase that trimethylates the N-terminal glycine 'Gly- 2' of elongation factor 1-alpha, before also catalyzing the mono- and dimethylation of 'Lys-3' [Lyophyllum shimeji]|uniref:Protein N-terminal and lysine N-methyltransferase EFM7 n=1 Tax=Lyophyllum shimeji TaxID=47721 RepID=A0A9P3PX28_LYOSH|nr:putative S-adenosyl-L-methionine-dependent protein methyltransferase that trimethylates the N-terminal glycine 'Gly- 2' of elongation factor 1-alpha, before also catalyzing the mono- and dimethylation of 'Lys-3' [Lyophyllum shimeji]